MTVMTMQRIKVLVVDDSAVLRRVISDMLSTDADIEVVGTAANGRIALQKIGQLRPDVVSLDVEMPEMDGLQCLKAIRQDFGDLPVIMLSAIAEKGGRATLEALSLGANDYVTKPSTLGPGKPESIRDELLAKVKLFGKRRSGSGAMTPRPSLAPPSPLPAPPLRVASTFASRIDAVVIGISTGGPNALEHVIPKLPENLSVPVLVVQHMPPVFTRLLAERLDERSKVSVREAADGESIRPGVVYIAPGDWHMSVFLKGGIPTIRTHQSAPENSCRPAADVLFRSAAEVYGARTLAVVMTGMGSDGLLGCEALSKVHGHIIVQDEKTSVVWGMPGFVARANLADAILPLGSIANEIAQRVQSPLAFRRQASG